MQHIKVLGLAALLLASLGLASPASAVPFTPTPLGAQADNVVAVGYWCGPGRHLNPWGVCVLNRGFYGPRFYGPRPGFYGPRRFGGRFYAGRRYHWRRNYHWHRSFHWHRR